MIPPGCCPVVLRTPGTALNDPVNLTVALSLSPFLIIIFHIAEGRLVRQGANGPCPEGLAVAEDNLRVIVGLTLVFSGEVQVNIRLLVPFKSEEGFKRNVKSVLFQRAVRRRPGISYPAYRSHAMPA